MRGSRRYRRAKGTRIDQYETAIVACLVRSVNVNATGRQRCCALDEVP